MSRILEAISIEVAYPCNRPCRSIRLGEGEYPTFSRQSAQMAATRKLLALMSVRSLVDPRGILLLEGLGKLVHSVTLSGVEPATVYLLYVKPCSPITIYRRVGGFFRAEQ